ncbi:MAG: hypothetical protein FWD54_06190 [Endomicrobia bacterium]|nr:hypothetical protein [Endomicrobiia bacterium]MCL2799845.1 hypothetical protein [Endomicrobiia bacterium]
MKKILELILLLIVCFSLFVTTGYAKETDEQKARSIFEKAVSIPQQAFPDAKTLYVKSVQTIELSDNFKALDRTDILEAFSGNRIEQEYWRAGNRFRLSTYNKNPFANIKMHFIFDGKVLTVLSNMTPKEQVELTDEEARTFALAEMSKNSVNAFKKIFDEMVRFEFLGTKKIGSYNCYVVQTVLIDENAELGDRKEFFKTRYFIDKKTNIAVRTEIDYLGSIISEVKKIEKINGKFVPVIIESYMENLGKTIITYDVKVNQPIDPEVFDESKITLEMSEKYGEQTQMMQQLINSITDFIKAFSESNEELNRQLEQILDTLTPQERAEYEKQMKEIFKSLQNSDKNN